MSKIELIYSGIPNFLPQTRGDGIHLSSIINALAVRYDIWKPSDIPDKSRMQLGLALEHAIAHRQELDNPGDFVRVGEIEKDGIKGNLDLLQRSIYNPWEIKLTWLSTIHDIRSQKLRPKWWQAQGYAAMIESDEATLAMCHVDGDYTYPKRVIYNVWRQWWTKQEMINHWNFILRHKDMGK